MRNRSAELPVRRLLRQLAVKSFTFGDTGHEAIRRRIAENNGSAGLEFDLVL